ncbi:MAG: 50S ribosomal protein L10 [Proteobacteria bacterium]|nr:50S ribosomal protein L10 [Pseudomonadota bacterium]
MDRTKKEAIVGALRQIFSDATIVVVVHQTGLSASESSDLRRSMREGGATYRVTKNSLTRRALDGSPAAAIADLFSGPTAIGYSADPVAAAKIIVDFAKKSKKLVVLGGTLGETVLDAQAVGELAKLPSLDELRGKLVGLLQAPAGKLVGVLQAPAGQLARVVMAYAQTGDAEGSS